MLEKDTLADRIKASIPILSVVALIIGCILGLVMIVVLLKMATEC